MIEQTIIEYLNNEMIVPVLAELPEVPSEDYPEFPEKLVVLERVGGSKTNHISVCSIAFQAYASTLFEAVQLDEEVKRTVPGLIVLDTVSSVRLSSSYNHTDPSTKRNRYQSVFEIYYYDE